ncbi:MAG: hypothetical protein R3C56_15230 [Pirellulaceae bacterium]
MLAEIGRWDEAIDDFQRVIDSGEASYRTWHLKLSRTWVPMTRQDISTASEMARKFANTSNQLEAYFTTWTLALGPEASVQPRRFRDCVQAV